MTVQHFYDGDGRQVETVAPAPGGQYVVQYTFYDPASGQVGFQSQPYFVSGGGFSIPASNVQSSQDGTGYTYDGLGRVLTTENALSQTTTTSYIVVCPSLSGIGSGCYEQTTVVDANGHQTATLADGWGRTAASETFTGSAAPYTLSQQTVDSYDENGHLTTVLQPDGTSKTTLTTNSSTLFETTPSYDAAGNVVAVNTTLPQGTDNQVFCYDDLDRLTWAGSTGTPACGGTLTAGTLTSAQYSASYSYDTLNRLTSGPLGTYSYGDSAHLHGATSVGSAWTGSYDAAGDLVCRASTNTTTCTGGSPTGATLSYDAAGQLSHWQNAPGAAPTSAQDTLYDGEGNRVLQQSTTSGTTTTTGYDTLGWVTSTTLPEEMSGATTTSVTPQF